MDTTANHFGKWAGGVVWIVLVGLFVLFTPFHEKSQRKPSSV